MFNGQVTSDDPTNIKVGQSSGQFVAHGLI